jgi:hypothetical protein
LGSLRWGKASTCRDLSQEQFTAQYIDVQFLSFRSLEDIKGEPSHLKLVTQRLIPEKVIPCYKNTNGKQNGVP